MGPKLIAHIFMIWELISYSQRTFVTQGFLVGVISVIRAPP